MEYAKDMILELQYEDKLEEKKKRKCDNTT